MNGNSTVAVVVESGGDQVRAHVGLHALGAFAPSPSSCSPPAPSPCSSPTNTAGPITPPRDPHSPQESRIFQAVDAFLFGRRTYEIFAAYWPKMTDANDPVASKLNSLPKYVASRSLDNAEWNNSIVISDVVAEVTRLKEQPGRELQVHGSGQLAQTLLDNGLVDEYRLFVHPVGWATASGCSSREACRRPCAASTPSSPVRA